MDAMAKKHSFKRSKAQYEGTLKKWGFRKNMSKDGWKHALHCVAKRKTQNKQSMVKVGGRARTEKSIAKAQYRYSYQTFAERLDALQSPAVRNSVAWTVRFEPESTHPSPALESAVSATNDLSTHYWPKKSMKFLANDPIALLMNENHSEYHAEIRQLSSFLPFDPDGNGQVSRLPTNTPYVEFLTGLYALSNNIITRNMEELVPRLLEICRSKDGLNFLRELLTSRNRTIMAAAEKLLVSAVDENDESLTKFLLNAGTSPDGMFSTHPECEPQSGLEIAVTEGYKNLTSLLIGAGARVDPFKLLFFALNSSFDIEIVKLILQHPVPDHENPQWNKYFATGLNVDQDILSIELADLLLVYISKTTGIDHKKAAEELLFVAVKSGKQEVIQYLLSFGARLHLNYEKVIEELLPVAVESGKQEVIQYLLSFGARLYLNYEKVIEGLLPVAVESGKQEVIQYLLSFGARLHLNYEKVIEGLLPVAVESGNQDLVPYLLCLGADSNFASPSKETILESAVRRNDILMVELLVSHGAVLNREQQGYKQLPTALQIAAQNGNHYLVCFLLNHGAHIEAEPFDYAVYDQTGFKEITMKTTTLQSGVKGGNLAVVEMLLKAGASLDESSQGEMMQTALEIACKGGSDDIIHLLLSYGAKVNAETKSLLIWHTPLTRALSRRRKHIIELLLERGADVCVAGGDIDMVKRLLDLGAHPCDSGALWAAAYTGSLQIIRLLLRHNEKFRNFHRDDSQINWNDYGRAAISTAIGKRDYESADLLLEAGVDVTCSPAIGLFGSFNGNDSIIRSTGRTALATAISVMEIHWVRVLLDAGADVNACPDGNYRYADCIFDYLKLTSQNIEEMVELLIAIGARINRCKSREPPLHRAVSQNLPAVVRLFLLKGADINLLPGQYHGRTALQLAAEENLVDMVKILIESGADTNARPAEYGGATAIQFAAINGNFKILQLLLAASANLFAPRGIWNGRTALEGAAEHGRLDMVQFILMKFTEMEGLYFEHQLCRAIKYARDSGHGVLAEMIQSHQVEKYGSSDCRGHESVFVLELRGESWEWDDMELLIQARTVFPGRCFDSDLYDEELDPAVLWPLSDDDSDEFESADQDSKSIAAPSAPVNNQEPFIPNQDIIDVVSPTEMEGVDFGNDWHPEEPHSQQGYQHGYDEMLMVPPFDIDQMVPEVTSPGFIIEELF
ncbi:multiple ankyrin repeats single kh domain protein [Rutstroemia sp. NJR-2017a BVV2]|nr:multiple ankyrin repeats single kh domain protein [Rutstroemia sp. NJR-2017a BVV2]